MLALRWAIVAHWTTCFPAIMPWILNYLFWILPLCMGVIISIAETDVTIAFGWNVTNPSFRNENGAYLEVSYLSYLDIICPYRVDEYYKIYWVTKEVFENCCIPTNVSEPLHTFLICDSPYRQKRITLLIDSFQSIPDLQEFQIGQNYYLATMSSGTPSGLNNTCKGACRDEQNKLYMKLNISVVDKPYPTTNAPTGTTTTSSSDYQLRVQTNATTQSLGKNFHSKICLETLPLELHTI